jgi:hypothetical protein
VPVLGELFDHPQTMDGLLRSMMEDADLPHSQTDFAVQCVAQSSAAPERRFRFS